MPDFSIRAARALLAVALALACSSNNSDSKANPSSAGGGTAVMSGGGGGETPNGSVSGGAGETANGGSATAAGSSGTAGSTNGVGGAPSTMTDTGRFPAPNASVCADAPLRLSFPAPVTVGSSGKIQVFKLSAPDTAVDSIDVAATSFRDTIEGRAFYKVKPIFLEGNDVVMYLKTKALAAAETYFVTVDAGVFVDAAKAPLPAISGTAWQFHTVAPAPAAANALTVSREGGGDFCTVQGAIDFIPAANASPVTISIKNGTYHEIVYIPSKSKLTLKGEDRKKTIIAYPNNDALQQKLGTGFRAMIEAESSNQLTLSTLTLHNTTPQGGSQAEALRIEPGDQARLLDSDFISLQDTLLLSGRAYVSNSYVEGNVDFIWGKGAAYFVNSEIKTVGRPGYLVQSRNGLGYGYVFVDSTFTTDGHANGTLLARIEGDRFPLSSVAYVNCKFAPSLIAPAGWLITNSTGASTTALDLTGLRFWEYQSTDLDGKALDVSQRDPAAKQVDATQAAMLRDPSQVLAGWTPDLLF